MFHISNPYKHKTDQGGDFETHISVLPALFSLLLNEFIYIFLFGNTSPTANGVEVFKGFLTPITETHLPGVKVS